MRSLLGFGLLTLGCVIPAAAQFGAQNNALGGAFASRGMSRPLGGISPPSAQRNFNPNVRRDRDRRGVALPYAYSFYIPNYFDSFGADSYPPPPVAGPYAPQTPPVIINQYFSNQAPGLPPDLRADNGTEPPQQTARNSAGLQPGDPLGTPENYYLIAYKNHAVHTALAYWIEDNTLHYVTTENTHNQASLDLIDTGLTKTLNQARGIDFSIPGR